jgi:hypothetical protein
MKGAVYKDLDHLSKDFRGLSPQNMQAVVENAQNLLDIQKNFTTVHGAQAEDAGSLPSWDGKGTTPKA